MHQGHGGFLISVAVAAGEGIEGGIVGSSSKRFNMYSRIFMNRTRNLSGVSDSL